MGGQRRGFRQKLKKKLCSACGSEYFGYNRKIVCTPCRDAIRRQRASEPEGLLRKNAYVAVRRALRSGSLQRGSCAICDEPDAQAHHENYAEPLNITWLCASCHDWRHSHLKMPEPRPINEWIGDTRRRWGPGWQHRIERMGREITWHIEAAIRAARVVEASPLLEAAE